MSVANVFTVPLFVIGVSFAMGCVARLFRYPLKQRSNRQVMRLKIANPLIDEQTRYEIDSVIGDYKWRVRAVPFALIPLVAAVDDVWPEYVSISWRLILSVMSAGVSPYVYRAIVQEVPESIDVFSDFVRKKMGLKQTQSITPKEHVDTTIIETLDGSCDADFIETDEISAIQKDE